MKIGVVGAGAMGGLIGARLALAGEEVTLIDLEPVLSAIERNGLRLVETDATERITRAVRLARSGTEAGEQDLVLLAVKAHQLPDVAAELPAFAGAHTVFVTLQNGLPWWYFQRHGGEWDGRRIACLDPDGVLERNIRPDQVLGCVAYPAAEVISPGVIRHVEGDRFPLGELGGSESDRAEAAAAAFIRAGFRARVLQDVRAELWLKAVGSAAFNPLSAVTGRTMAGICAAPDTRERALKLMMEAQLVAAALGVTLRVPLERRLEGAAAVGHHKTSMLQDLEAGRRLELDALVVAVIELGHLTGVPTPELEKVYVEARALDRTLPLT
ncbi:MAG: ketopantoate reductase family protein [Gemmatimonadales bacterium]